MVGSFFYELNSVKSSWCYNFSTQTEENSKIFHILCREQVFIQLFEGRDEGIPVALLHRLRVRPVLRPAGEPADDEAEEGRDEGEFHAEDHLMVAKVGKRMGEGQITEWD